MERRPISLLQFTNTTVRAGVEEHILTLLRGLDRSHFRLHLVCPPELAEELRPDVPADVELIPLFFGKPTQLAAAYRLAKILGERQVEILHSHMFYSSLFASPVGWLRRVPVVIETSHGREQWRKGWFKSRFWIDRAVSRCVDSHIAVSEANGRYLLESKRYQPKKVAVIQNGCDLSRFERGQAAGLRESLGIAADDPALVVAGRLEPQKGHCVLFDALPSVLAEFPKTRLVCVGEGSLRHSLEAQANALGVRDAIHFVGYQTNVPDWLAMSDIAVLPSFYEGLPLVAIEALAAGKPLVATAVDGSAEVVIHEKTGLTVAPGDAAGLSGQIRRLLRDPDLRRRLGRDGRQWVGERFDQRRQIRQTEQLYFEALGRRCSHGNAPAAASTDGIWS